MAEDQLKAWSEKLSTIQKMIITIGAIAVSLWAAVEWVSMRVTEHDEKVMEQTSDIFTNRVLQIIEQSGIATLDDIDSIGYAITDQIESNAEANEAMHLRTLRRQDTIVVRIEDHIRLEDDLNVRLDTIELYIKTINGTAQLSITEQHALAREDSLRSILLLERQKTYNTARMRQLEIQHRQALDEIRDLSAANVIDKGRRRKVRHRPANNKTWRHGE